MKLRQRFSTRQQAAFLFLVCLAFPALVAAQRATLLGTVTDQNEAVIPGVQVTLLNLDQGLKREATTNQNGYYTVPLLQPGRYLVTAQKPGFAIAEIRDVILHVDAVRVLNLKLQVGGVTVAIEVHEKLQDIDTAGSAISHVVTGDVVRDAPLNGRNVPDLALLQPGVTPTDPDDSGAGTFNIHGNRSDSVVYLLDGGLNNDLIDNHAVYTPNPDTIAEFRVFTSNYPAEYGRNSGGVITMATRSGTNQWHGSLFDFLRNDALDANSFFNKSSGLPRDILKRNQFGGTFGGPISVPHVVAGKDRAFFFLGYQGERQVDVLSVHDVPTFTPAELDGNFSSPPSGGGPDPGVVCFLTGYFPNGQGCGSDANGNPAPGTAYTYFQPDPKLRRQAIIDPRRINSVAQNYIKAGLVPTSPTGLLSWQGRETIASDELTVKLDFDLDPKDKLALTLGWSHENEFSPSDPFSSNVPGFPESSDFNDYFVTLSHTHIFSLHLLNELRGTAERVHDPSLNPGVQLPRPAALGITITPDLPTGPSNLVFDTGLQTGFSTFGPQLVTDNTYTFSDTLTWIRGEHNFKLGGGLSAFQNNTFLAFTVDGQFQFVGGPAGLFTQNSFADFLLGLPTQYTQSSAAPSNVRSKYFFGFAQDEWRLRSNLELSLGLRYEYSTPKSDTEGRTFSILPGEQSRVFVNAPVGMVFPGDAGAPRGVNFPDRNNWAPRIGFAWDPRGDGKTSLRGAFGVFYDILKAEDNLQFNGQPPFYASAGLAYSPLAGNPTSEVNYMSQPFVAVGAENPFPSQQHPPADLNFAAAGYLPIGGSGSVFVVDPHLRTPYTYQYHLSLQRELAKETVLEANYVGSSSHGLTALVDANPFVLGTYNRALNLTPGNQTCTVDTAYQCSFASLYEFKNVTEANYNGLIASLQKQISGDGIFGGSYFTLAYTYSHNIDNASGFQNRNNVVPYYQPGLFRASADMDVRHRVIFSGGWNLPFYKLSSAPPRLTRGWKLFPIVSWQSGFPLDVFANLPSAFNFASPGPSGAGDAELVRANLLGPVRMLDPHTVQTIAGSSGNYWFNPVSFSTAQCPPPNPGSIAQPCQPSSTMFPNDAQAVSDPAVRTYGTLPRNYFRGPGRFNIDLAFSKTTSLSDRLQMELRADFFNLTNHTEFANPDTNITSSTFGQVVDTFPPRIIQLALRFSF